MNRRVVITGIGAVTPIGNNVNEFWAGLKSGRNGIAPITKIDTAEFKVKIAGEVKGFNPLLVFTENEIKKNDLYTQYAMVAAQEAITDSSISGKIDPERFGVYIGTGVGGMDTLLSEYDKLNSKGPRWTSPFLIPMMIANIASATIAIKFNAKGVNLPVVLACSTGTNAIGEAYRTIKHGYADGIIAGGVEAPINRLALAGFQSCMALTSNNDVNSACCPFDKRRSGFVIGEGAGTVVLEEYEHAKARGAKIYAEIAGYGNTCDAYHITSPSPDGEGGARAIKIALDEAKYTSGDNLYINAHGTSTLYNDKFETAAIKTALGKDAYKCLVSSTKSMTGHLLGGAGAIEAVASICALNNSIVPPTINYMEADPDCDLDYVPNKAREKELSIVISTSLGFGGHNACIAFRKV